MNCPICRKPTKPEMRPFCSKRCANVDLAKWLGGEYTMPSTDPDDVEQALEAIEKLPLDKDKLH